MENQIDQPVAYPSEIQPNQPSVTPPITQPLPLQPSPDSSKQNLWQIIAIVLLLLLVGTIGALAYSISKDDKQPLTAQSTPTPVMEANTGSLPTPIVASSQPVVSPASDETNNWDSYSSPTYSYSFRYPTTWYGYFFNETGGGLGTHTVQNFSSDEIEKYMDHGIVDWERFGKAAVKAEIAYRHFTFPEKVYASDSDNVITINNLDDYINKVLLKLDGGLTDSRSSDVTLGQLKTTKLSGTNTEGKYTAIYYATPNSNDLLTYSVRVDNLKQSFEATEDFRVIKNIAKSFTFKK